MSIANLNSNCLLFTLKAPFSIECHFLSIILYIYIYNLLRNHWATSSSYFLPLLFSFKPIFSLLLKINKQQQKPLLLHISPHLRLYSLQHFTSVFASLPPPLLFTSPLHFLHHFLFLIIWLFSFPFYFCINLISFSLFNPYFSHTKIEYSLSLLIFFWWIFVLSYNSN